MRITLIYEAIFIAVSLGVAEIFRKYFIHVYRVGRDNVLKSFGLGAAALVALWALIFLGAYTLPERWAVTAVELLVVPVLIISFSTGCALAAGLAGIDGARYRSLAIILAGGFSTAAEYFYPVPGRLIYSLIFVYGLGAAILSLRYPVQDAAELPGVRASSPAPDQLKAASGDAAAKPQN